MASLRIPMFNELNRLLDGNLLILLKETQTKDREAAWFELCEFDWKIYNDVELSKEVAKHKVLVVTNTKDALTHLHYKLNGVKIVYWMGENSQTFRFRSKTIPKKLSKQLIYKGIDYFAAYSQESIEFLKEKYSITRAIQVPQSVDYYSFEERVKGVDNEKIRFLVVSRLIENKLLARLIDEFIKLKCKYPNIILDIYGKGPEDVNLRRQVNNVDFINVKGFLSYKDVLAKYCEYDYFFMQTIEDSWGLTVNEAIASKLGIIVSKYAPAKEMISNGKSGFVYDPYRSQDYDDALRWAIDNRENLDKITESNYTNAIDNYGYDKSAKAFFRINKLLSEQ